MKGNYRNSGLLAELPLPETKKEGWPWTTESSITPPTQPDGSEWPRISIVTPSFNQAEFLEETIRSILLQNYPRLEYIIMDGGSTDNSAGIIRKYEAWLDHWESGPDSGQSNAINKGFRKAGGDYCNWICSDDLLCRDALFRLAPVIAANPGALILGKGIRIGRNGELFNEIPPSAIRNIYQLTDIRNYWRNSSSIMQQSAFFPLSAAEKPGFLNENNHYTMDYELWGRLLAAGTEVVTLNENIGIFRWYEGQKTSRFNTVTKSLAATAFRLSSGFPLLKKIEYRAKLAGWFLSHHYHSFRSRLGIRKRLKKLLDGGTGDIY